MIDYDALAQFYSAGRPGYSNELYNAIAGYGLNPRHHVLDLGCGSGIASKPLVENGFRVTGVDPSESMLARARERFASANWKRGRAEEVPAAAHEFDAVVCAQAFHRFDRPRAFAEIARVLKPHGIVAIWWKALAGDDPVKVLRDGVYRELGIDPIPEGLAGGFKEFYAAPLDDKTLRVVPWRLAVPLDEFLMAERSRARVRETAGTANYATVLEQHLRRRYGQGNVLMPLSYMQFLYLARTPQ